MQCGFAAAILCYFYFVLVVRFVFLIPAESGEKITLGISTMLNMTVFLMTVMSGLPPNDQTPLISKYKIDTSKVTAITIS
jgi:nicotinic acetylcholine receptor